MWNRLLLLLILFFISSIFPQESIDDENSIISWDPIPNAVNYQIEIRNEEEEVILKEIVDETSFEINFEPGNYSHRVGAFNKFNKISSYSDWFPFVITRSLSPEVLSEKVILSSRNEDEKTITIKGKNFYKNTIFSLSNTEGKVIISNLKLKKGIFEVVIDNKNTKAGNYNLTLENPRKKILIIKNFYQLKQESFFKFISNSRYPYWKEASMSTILPGWGQIKKGHIFTAIFLDLGLLAGAGYYKSTVDNFQTDKSKYNQNVSNGILFQILRIQGAPLYGLMESENQFHKTESSAARIGTASAIVASIYVINILDALLWKTSVKTASSENSFHFYSKFEMSPTVNPFSNSQSKQFEFGIQFQF